MGFSSFLISQKTFSLPKYKLPKQSPSPPRCSMYAIEDKLKAIVKEVLKLDERDLLALLPTFHSRIEEFQSISEWEEACILYFLINGVRIKSIQLADRVQQINSRHRKRTERDPEKKDDGVEKRAALRPVSPQPGGGSESPAFPPRARPVLTLVK